MTEKTERQARQNIAGLGLLVSLADRRDVRDVLDELAAGEDEYELLKALPEANGDQFLSLLLPTHEAVEVIEHLFDELALVSSFVERAIVFLGGKLTAKCHADGDDVERIATDVLVDDVANSLAVAFGLVLVVFVFEVLGIDGEHADSDALFIHQIWISRILELFQV